MSYKSYSSYMSYGRLYDYTEIIVRSGGLPFRCGAGRGANEHRDAERRQCL